MELEQRFSQYSSLAILQKEICMSRKKAQCCLSKIEDELSVSGFAFKEEDARAYNFISVLKWILGDQSGALEFSDKALAVKSNNIAVLANQAFMLHDQCDFASCKDICSKIETISENRFQVLVALHEIAFCYSRSGIRFCPKAIDLFDNILQEAEGIDNKDEEMISFITLWKFGLGLCHRRLSNTSNTHKVESLSQYHDRIRQAALAFSDLLQYTDNETYKGRALVQLGEIKDSLGRSPEEYRNTLQNLLPEDIKAVLSRDLYERAYTTAGDDVYVLERCGRYFRYCKDFCKAEYCLKKAIAIRPTSFAHHHLAMLLKSKLNKQISKRNQGEYKRSLSDNIPSHVTPPKFHTPMVNPAVSGKASAFQSGVARNLLPMLDFMQDESQVNKTPCKNVDEGQLVERLSMSSIDDKHQNSIQKNRPEDSSKKQNTALGEIKYKDVPFFPSQTSQTYKTNRRSTQNFHDVMKNQTDRGGKRCSTSERNSDRQLSENSQDRSWKVQGRRKHSRNYTGRQFNQTFQNIRPSSSQPANTVYSRMVKSPAKVLRLPCNEKSNEIEEHLSKAIEISGNTGAMYEKGLLFRSLGKFVEAKTIFMELCRNTEETSEVNMANSFEQQAFCILEEAATVTNKDVRKKMEYNATRLLLNAVEMTTNIAIKMPVLNGCWTGLEELKRILNESEKTIDCLRQLWMAHECAREFEEAIQCQKEILKMDPKTIGDATFQKKIIDNCLKVSDYAEAIQRLKILEKIDSGMVDYTQYIKANLSGGFECLRRGETVMARSRLKDAFSFYKEKQGILKPEDDDVEMFDIFILCECDADPQARSLWALLNRHCGLSVTINEDDIRCGMMKHVALGNVQERSSHYVIFLDKDTDIGRNVSAQMILDIHNGSESKRRVLLLNKPGESVEVPRCFRHFPVKEFALNTEIFAAGAQPSEMDYNWLESLLLEILRQEDDT